MRPFCTSFDILPPTHRETQDRVVKKHVLLRAVNCVQFNLSHHVGHLSFGMDYPGQVNPLDGTEQFADKGDDVFAIFAFNLHLNLVAQK